MIANEPDAFSSRVAQEPQISVSNGKLGLAAAAANMALISACVGAVAIGPTDVEGWQSGLAGLRQAYLWAIAAHPVALKASISMAVYGMGDLTAQAYEKRGQVDMLRIGRSATIGLLHGSLSHFVFSSPGCVVDSMVDSVQDLQEWQQPLAKIALDQTAVSLCWNTLYFGMLGALRGDSLGSVFAELRSCSWSLLKAGWRLWPLAHILTYAVVPAEHRLLYVDMVELAWVSILLYYAHNTSSSASDNVAADTLPAPLTLERAASDEMRVLLLDGSASDADDSAVRDEVTAAR